MLKDLKTQLGRSLRELRHLLERPTRAQPGSPNQADIERRRERNEKRRRMRAMQRDLHDLLQRHSGARLLMAHLDVVERTLRHQRIEGVEKLPVRLLAKALAQMERLVWDWSPAGLAELRSRMAILVKQRRDELAGKSQSTAHETDFEASIPQTEMVEVDHAIFEEMERSWAGRMPADVAAAVAQAD